MNTRKSHFVDLRKTTNFGNYGSQLALPKAPHENPHQVMQRPTTSCRRVLRASGGASRSSHFILPLFLAIVSVPAEAWMGHAPAGGLAVARAQGVCAVRAVRRGGVSLRASAAVSRRSSSLSTSPDISDGALDLGWGLSRDREGIPPWRQPRGNS